MDASDAAASLLTIFETTDQGPSSDGPPGAQGAATARQELTQQPDHVRAQPAQGAPAAASGGLLLHPGYQTQQLLQPQNYAMPAMSAAPQLMSNPGKRTASGQPASDRPAARQTPQQPALQQQPSAAPPAAAAGVRGGDWDSSRPAITLDLSTKDWVLTSGTEWIPWVEVRDANRLFPPARTLSNPPFCWRSTRAPSRTTGCSTCPSKGGTAARRRRRRRLPTSCCVHPAGASRMVRTLPVPFPRGPRPIPRVRKLTEEGRILAETPFMVIEQLLLMLCVSALSITFHLLGKPFTSPNVAHCRNA